MTRLVLLERDDLARELYTEYLVGAGYRVRAETLFDDAIAALGGGAGGSGKKAAGVPLFIAGIAPGGATVAQIAAAVRRAAPHTAVLALLGRDAAEGTLRAVRDGALEALAKPVAPEALLLAVRRCLDTVGVLERHPDMRRHFAVFNAARRIQRAVEPGQLSELLLEACLSATGAEAGLVLRAGDGGARELWAARGLDEQAARDLAAGLDWAALAEQPGPVAGIPPLPQPLPPVTASPDDVTPHPQPLPVAPPPPPPPRARAKALAQLIVTRVGAAGAEKLWVGLALGTRSAAAFLAAPEAERRAREAELTLYAGEAAFALEAMRGEGLEASFDPLTDLLDERSLSRAITREIALAKKSERGASVLTLDVRRIDEARAAHGDLVVRQALVEAARLISRQVREVDLVARTGDSAFGVLLPATPLTGGRRAAERLKASFAGRRFLAREGLDLPLEVEVGVAGYPEHGDDAAALLDAARTGAPPPSEKRGVLGGRKRVKA